MFTNTIPARSVNNRNQCLCDFTSTKLGEFTQFLFNTENTGFSTLRPRRVSLRVTKEIVELTFRWSIAPLKCRQAFIPDYKFN
jgi:hypothetical protein